MIYGKYHPRSIVLRKHLYYQYHSVYDANCTSDSDCAGDSFTYSEAYVCDTAFNICTCNDSRSTISVWDTNQGSSSTIDAEHYTAQNEFTCQPCTYIIFI